MITQPSWRRAIAEGRSAAEQITSLMWGDLDETIGGIGWWEEHLPAGTRAALGDYLVSVGYAVSDSLGRLAYSADEYGKTVTSRDYHFRNQLIKAKKDGRGRPPDMRSMTEADINRDTKEDVLMVAFYVSAASLMDNLAALTIGTLGLGTNVLRADAAFLELREAKTEGGIYPPGQGKLAKSLRESESEAGRLQRETLRAVRASVHQAGPADWWSWTDDMRNVQAHQGKRSNFTMMPKVARGKSEYLASLAPRQPRMTDVQNHQIEELAEAWIMEDSRDLITGLLSSLNAATVGILIALKHAWEARQQDHALIQQPAVQWPEPPAPLAFPGYGRTVEMAPGSNIYVSPVSARRFLASRPRD